MHTHKCTFLLDQPRIGCRDNTISRYLLTEYTSVDVDKLFGIAAVTPEATRPRTLCIITRLRTRDSVMYDPERGRAGQRMKERERVTERGRER